MLTTTFFLLGQKHVVGPGLILVIAFNKVLSSSAFFGGHENKRKNMFLYKVLWRVANLSVFSVGPPVNFFIHILSSSKLAWLSPYICSVNISIRVSILLQPNLVQSVHVAQCQVMNFRRSSCRPELPASSAASDFRECFLRSKSQLPASINTREWFEILCFFPCFNMFFFVAWCVYHLGSGCHSNGNSSKCNWM